MSKTKNKRDMWLVFYGIVVTLFIQVFIASFGIFSNLVGLVTSVIGMAVLGVYAFNGFSWKKNANKEIDEEKEFRQRAIQEFDRIDVFLMQLPKETEPEKASDAKT
jgi:predicted membrane protein